MSTFHEIDGMSFPDAKIFDELAKTFEEWGSQQQDFLQQLKTGYDALRANWEEDGAASYSRLHARALDAGDKHVKHFQNVSRGLKDVGEKVGIAQRLLIVATGLVAAAVAVAIFTFGITLAAASAELAAAELAAAGVAAAMTSEGIAVAAPAGLFLGLLGTTNPLLPAPGIGDDRGSPTCISGLLPGPSFPLWSPPQLPAPVSTSGLTFYLGTIISANPNIWLYLPSLGSDRPQYIISTNRPPGDLNDWFSVNQFCSFE